MTFELMSLLFYVTDTRSSKQKAVQDRTLKMIKQNIMRY